MTDISAISALRVANEAFLVASMIERCPKTMMIRELVVNGIEAAEHAPEGRRLVRLYAQTVGAVPKLCIWNTGPGLEAGELLQITDLASSLRKENSLDKNFGMGAKVASLPSNRHGLRYRSCKGGRVSEVMLGQREGVYGRLRRGPAGEEAIDVTDQTRAEGLYDLGEDWTEVLLLGNTAGQNTVSDPYGGPPLVTGDWLPRYLEQRFFRLPAGVDIDLASEVSGGRGAVRLRGAVEGWEASEHKQSVTTPSGIALHYGFNAPAGTAPGAPGEGRGGVVYRGEIYDIRAEQKWLVEAPAFGIPFGAAFVSAYVELPDDYLVLPEAYRQFLRFRGGDQKQVFLGDFGPVVRAFMPDWLKQIIRALGPQQADYLDTVSDELRDLLAELEVPLSRQSLPPGAEAPKAPPAPPREPLAEVPNDAKQREQVQKAPPPPPKPRAKNYERPPEIIGLRAEAMIAERALEGRAAKFYPQSHQLFLNLTYPAIADMAEQLAQEVALERPTVDEEALRHAALDVAEWCITRKVSRALVYSLAKKGAGWLAEEVNRAQSPECLSLVADDWQSMAEIGRRRLTDALPAEAELPGLASEAA